jgi:hypothetical protein
MATRAKFRCNSLKHAVGSEGQIFAIEVVLNPVYSNDEGSENRAFWNATPNGSLSMTINNAAAFKAFELGKEYYLDITEA